MSKVEDLFRGIAVIFDDEIDKEDSKINRIKKAIEKRAVPVATFKELPHEEMIPSLANASFIILDWDFIGINQNNNGERLSGGTELIANSEKRLVDFIKKTLQRIFVPVFIFSHLSEEEIRGKLIDADISDEDITSRIFIKAKNSIKEDDVFKDIEGWLKDSPTIYVLKEWEMKLLDNENKMLLEFYRYSPDWVRIIWNMLKKDGTDYEQEFGNFLTRSLNNRIQEYHFDENFIKNQKDKSDFKDQTERTELIKVLQGERYFSYPDGIEATQPYTGDLFKLPRGKYLLNIRAQCDLSRKDNNGRFKDLYCLKGKVLEGNEFSTNYLEIKDCELRIDNDTSIKIDVLQGYCSSDNTEKLNEINKKLKKHRDNMFFRKGNFIEHSDSVIIGCVANKLTLKFDLDIQIKPFEEIKEKRVGRILPPYITRIQQKCAQNMIREGFLPIPENFFNR